MADVEQLLVGYTADDPNPDGRYGASGSVTLIRDGDARILVDVGDPWNGSQVVDKLRLRSLAPNQITHVVITHGHIDHAGNLNLFSEARIIMDSDECVRGAYGTISTEELLSPNVRVCRFRGHTGSDLCVFATTNAHQCIAVAGDLFECEEDDDLWRNTSQFLDDQLDSRQRILDLADFIIPGHGPIFPVSDAKDAEPTLPDDIE